MTTVLPRRSFVRVPSANVAHIAYIFALVCAFFAAEGRTHAQAYLFGTFGSAFPRFDKMNAILAEFDVRNNHRLGTLDLLTGGELGVGVYGPRTMMEGRIGFLSRTLESNVPGNFKENALVQYQQNYLSYAFGYRPFANNYSVIGTALNISTIGTAYSFGGDYITTNNDYLASADVFVDLAFKLRLRKKRTPLLVRFRPYYQFGLGVVDLRKLEVGLNENPDAKLGSYNQEVSYFGLRLSLLVPLTKDRRTDPWDGYKLKY